MSKFKVGDKVRVVRIEIDGVPKAAAFIGKFGTVEGYCGNGYILSFNGVRYKDLAWTDYELVNADFTKSDLKDGMVVEFRDGGRRILLNGHLMTNNSVLDTYHFTEDLQHQFDDFTIDKVYTSNAKFGMDYFKDMYLKLIWEREPEYKEMTVAEIEEKLGYKIKVISDD